MINMEAEEESLVRSASVAAKELRRKASQAAIELDHLANGGSEHDAEAAKKLLNSAVLNAGLLVNDATLAAKKLLASAAKIAASHKDSLMMKVVAKSSEFDFLYAEAAELIEARKLFLLSQAEFAAADLKRGAIEEALSVADIAAHVPSSIGEGAKKLVNDAATSAKALIKSAAKDAELLLSDAVETAMSLLLRDQEVEEEMLKLRKLAAIASLAGGIAHDFNNILTGVFGNLEMAKLHFPPAHVAYQYILAADQSMERAATLTRQLLTFAKGGDPLFEVIDIRSIIHESITLSLSVSSVKTILLLEDDLWMITADRGLLSQVMNNLIINADQAMTEGGTLTIEAMNSDELADDYSPHTSGRFVCIKISDDGRGISKARQKTIFDPYFTTKEAGSGLGLATALSIVTKHNGRISVASDVGKGTTFSIYLPAMPEAQLVDEPLINDKKLPSLYSGHVLLMDDEEAVLGVTAVMLTSLGYSVETSVDGKQAIQKYIDAEKRGAPFDLVILDLTVPNGMGGEDAVKELLGINPQVKVLVSSGYSSGNVLSNYAEYGFKGRIAKPFRMKTLETEVFNILNTV